MFGWFKKKKKKETKVVEATEVKRTETKVEEPKEKIEPAPETPEVDQKEEKKEKPRKMSYHITKHPKGGWQIKKGGADRALKRFDTQKQAIEYAKELEKNGASYIIHKADGTTRKKTY